MFIFKGGLHVSGIHLSLFINEVFVRINDLYMNTLYMHLFSKKRRSICPSVGPSYRPSVCHEHLTLAIISQFRY